MLACVMQRLYSAAALRSIPTPTSSLPAISSADIDALRTPTSPRNPYPVHQLSSAHRCASPPLRESVSAGASMQAAAAQAELRNSISVPHHQRTASAQAPGQRSNVHSPALQPITNMVQMQSPGATPAAPAEAATSGGNAMPHTSSASVARVRDASDTGEMQARPFATPPVKSRNSQASAAARPAWDSSAHSDALGSAAGSPTQGTSSIPQGRSSTLGGTAATTAAARAGTPPQQGGSSAHGQRNEAPIALWSGHKGLGRVDLSNWQRDAPLAGGGTGIPSPLQSPNVFNTAASSPERASLTRSGASLPRRNALTRPA